MLSVLHHGSVLVPVGIQDCPERSLHRSNDAEDAPAMHQRGWQAADNWNAKQQQRHNLQYGRPQPGDPDLLVERVASSRADSTVDLGHARCSHDRARET